MSPVQLQERSAEETGTRCALLARQYKTLRLEWSAKHSLLRVRTSVRPIQCYSLSGMAEIQQVWNEVVAHAPQVRHFVLSSEVPGVFNFGGDLALFALLVRARDPASLRMYGRRCIDLVWGMEQAAALGVHTTALVQGDALGGGLESILPFHRVIFERSAKAGFPEVLFNLFPGMGAWPFTIRRAGFAAATEMIVSGSIYGAEELHRRGVVDLVAPDGQGERALLEAVHATEPRLHGILAALEARRRAAPIAYESMEEAVELWVEAAMRLTDRDLRLMERLVRAQARKVGGAAEGAIEEIKKIELECAWRETGH